MTLQFQGDCPWCGTIKAGFTIVDNERISKYDHGFWDTFAICGYCYRGVVATYVGSPNASVGDVSQLRNVKFSHLTPSSRKISPPPHTPENIGRFYEQAMLSLAGGSYDAAGSMFRKTLDTGLKEKFPEIPGNLYTRIQAAAADYKLTPDVAEWANHIRMEGNQAVHDDEPYTPAQAKELQVFTELMLWYLFELPGRLAEARQVAASEEDADAP